MRRNGILPYREGYGEVYSARGIKSCFSPFLCVTGADLAA